jgi:hypothetical protein
VPNGDRADLVLISENPDRFVHGGIMFQLRRKQTMVGLSRLGCAAGVCVLAAGLLMGAGGAVAVADPGSSGAAAHGDHTTNASGQQHSTTAKKPKDEPGGKDTEAGSRASGSQPDQRHSTTAKKPKDEPGGTDTEAGSRASGSQPDQRHSTTAKKPKDEPGGTDTQNGTKDGSNRDAAVSDPVDAVVKEVAPVSDAVAPVSDPVDAVTDEVAPVSDAVAPVSDPVVSAVGASHDRRLWAAGGASVAARSPMSLPLILGPPLAGAPRLPVTGKTTGAATLDVFALGRASGMSGMAPLAPGGASSIGAGSSLWHVFGELLLPVSLWVLAVGALPGVGGLVIFFSIGARLGYRQAKAGFAIRTAGVASFARSGAVPFGLVRSGSLVVIRPRALRVVGRGALNAEHLLDEVA